MAYYRPISIEEASKLSGLTKSGVIKAISSKRLVAVALNEKGLMLSREQVAGEPFSEADFRKLCRRYVSVPEACDIVVKTDAMVMRDLRSGKIKGFKLNGKAWAVEKASAEQEFREYLASPRGRGQPRRIGESRSPRVIGKKTKKPLPRSKSSVKSRPRGK